MSVGPNPNPASPRCTFQWKYFARYAPSVLNVGSCDDPLKFGEHAHHFDYDNWGHKHARFTQGDAHVLTEYFDAKSFDCVIMGDIHEHLVNPLQATLQAAKVAKHMLVMTIFEEWRLPGFGQWIDEGTRRANEESMRVAGVNALHHQVLLDPAYESGGDVPHLWHINQFTDDSVVAIVRTVCEVEGFYVVEFLKAPEAVHEGHQWYNWLIALKRVEETYARKASEELEAVSSPTQEGVLEVVSG
jgi:hypothetical protein